MSCSSQRAGNWASIQACKGAARTLTDPVGVLTHASPHQFSPRNFTFNDVHATGAARIAAIAADAGVSRLIHVSHLNASADSPSAYLRSKAEGEELVKKAFDGATIARPGPLYGHEDRFLNQMASEYEGLDAAYSQLNGGYRRGH